MLLISFRTSKFKAFWTLHNLVRKRIAVVHFSALYFLNSLHDRTACNLRHLSAIFSLSCSCTEQDLVLLYNRFPTLHADEHTHSENSQKHKDVHVYVKLIFKLLIHTAVEMDWWQPWWAFFFACTDCGMTGLFVWALWQTLIMFFTSHCHYVCWWREEHLKSPSIPLALDVLQSFLLVVSFS